MRDIKDIARDIMQERPVKVEEEYSFWLYMQKGMDRRAWKKKMREIEEALLLLKLAGIKE
jgi:hypothetical protein